MPKTPKRHEEIILSMRHVDFAYGKNSVLTNINLELCCHDFFGLIGPNGGGKTTLLKIILGMIKPATGEVTVFHTTPEKARQKIGYVPQQTDLDLNYPISAQQVVMMGILGQSSFLHRFGKKEKDLALEALRNTEMENFSQTQIGELSGGQRQRVLIARALVRKPKLLLLDEPTSSVDTKAGTDLFRLLKKINRDCAIIVVSHDIGMISSYITKVGCLNHTLYTHDSGEINNDIIEAGYKCNVEILGHGIPHRILKNHANE